MIAPVAREVEIDVDGVTIGWGDHVLVKGVTFQVRRGEVFVILGGSGCGKSTLLRYLIGLQAPPAGRVVLQFVVDTAGAVEPATVRVREATHPAFAAAARAAVAQWRFRPATLAPGCPVKFLVTAPFDFAGG